jgi:hypothetical protein
MGGNNSNDGGPLVRIILAVLGLISAVTVAYLGYLQIVTPKKLELQATQTAEAAPSMALAVTSTPLEPTDISPPTATNTPVLPTPRATPRLISPAKGETVHNSQKEVIFEWFDALTDGEQYVLIIYHWSEYCRDIECTDVNWIKEGSSFTLEANQDWLWEENKSEDKKDWPVRWQVWVVDRRIPTEEPNHPPDAAYVLAKSERREIIITQ